MNKAEREGQEARQEGKPRSSNPYDKWFPSDSDKQNKADWKIGYDREDKARERKSKSR